MASILAIRRLKSTVCVSQSTAAFDKEACAAPFPQEKFLFRISGATFDSANHLLENKMFSFGHPASFLSYNSWKLKGKSLSDHLKSKTVGKTEVNEYSNFKSWRTNLLGKMIKKDSEDPPSLKSFIFLAFHTKFLSILSPGILVNSASFAPPKISNTSTSS